MKDAAVSKKIYVRIEYSTTIDNRPSDFGLTYKYSGFELHHQFSSGLSGPLPKYFDVAGKTLGDIDYVTYFIQSAQSNFPSDYYTKYTADGRTAAWWEVIVPDNFVISDGGGSGTPSVSQPIFAGPTVFPSEPLKIVEGNNKSQTINGTDGHELVNGHGGIDKIYLRGGDDYANGGAGKDKIFGGLGNDVLSGNGGNDKLYGENGNDWLFGDKGNDILKGGSGDDYLSGYHGADNLNGGNGNDKIQGGLGKDVLIGGLGEDIFFFQVAAGIGNSDRIVDFTRGEDQIQLSEDKFISDSSRIKFDIKTGEIFYDQHGYDNYHDYKLIATIKPGITLTTDDIKFV
jgi:Ca2+-binding RTX toxin-like protein